MANETTNLKLTKPLANEFYDINVFNDNFDKIDKELFDPSVTENTSYTTENGVKEFECKNGYVDNIVIEGQTKILNAENIEVEAGTDGAKLVSVGQGDKIEVLTKNGDETKQDKKQILTTLRSLPNGVKDTIEKRGNKYVKVQRCEEVVLNGFESNWDEGGQSNTSTIKPNIPIPNSIGKVNTNLYCDKFKAENIYDSSNINEGIYISSSNTLHIRINKTKADNLATFKTWLSQNPITVVYELATPIITELPNFNPQTFEGDTTLLINSGVIQAEADFEVTNSMGSEIEVLKGKVSSLDDYVVDEEVYYPTLLNGFEKTNVSDIPCVYKHGNICTMQFSIKNQAISTVGTVIAKLPSRMKPANYIRVVAMYGSASSSNLYNVDITTNGEIILYKELGANIGVRLNCSWKVGS